MIWTHVCRRSHRNSCSRLKPRQYRNSSKGRQASQCWVAFAPKGSRFRSVVSHVRLMYAFCSTARLRILKNTTKAQSSSNLNCSSASRSKREPPPFATGMAALAVRSSSKARTQPICSATAKAGALGVKQLIRPQTNSFLKPVLSMAAPISAPAWLSTASQAWHGARAITCASAAARSITTQVPSWHPSPASFPASMAVTRWRLRFFMVKVPIGDRWQPFAASFSRPATVSFREPLPTKRRCDDFSRGGNWKTSRPLSSIPMMATVIWWTRASWRAIPRRICMLNAQPVWMVQPLLAAPKMMRNIQISILRPKTPPTLNLAASTTA